MAQQRRRNSSRPPSKPQRGKEGRYQQLRVLTNRYEPVLAALLILILIMNVALFFQNQSLKSTVSQQEDQILDLQHDIEMIYQDMDLLYEELSDNAGTNPYS